MSEMHSDLKRLIEIWRKEADREWGSDGIGMHDAADQLERYLANGEMPEMPVDSPSIPPEKLRRSVEMATLELMKKLLTGMDGPAVDPELGSVKMSIRKPVTYKASN